MDTWRFVFLDETWVKKNMSRLYCRALYGRRLIDAVPHGHWHTTTVLMGFRSEGTVAPVVVDGPIIGSVFLDWVRQHLIKVLRPKDIIVMDNLSAHKIAGVQEAIEVVGAQVRYVSPYSPDLNPIENLFSKFKSLLRSQAARTVLELWKTVVRLIDRFPAGERLRYMLHAGSKLKNFGTHQP
ncbi:MAG: IS630 family transposase [Pirellulaceae bacterium]|nr:IS630 family transposase [Pirellulaceae bacterium]